MKHTKVWGYALVEEGGHSLYVEEARAMWTASRKGGVVEALVSRREVENLRAVLRALGTSTLDAEALRAAALATLEDPDASGYNFNLKANRVGVDTHERYGYWERRDGTEGGGLWFGTEGGVLVLDDFDGAPTLPQGVIDSLLSLGVEVGDEFL